MWTVVAGCSELPQDSSNIIKNGMGLGKRMNTGRAVAVVSALLAIASLVVAWIHYEGIMAIVSFFVLVFGVLASKNCTLNTNKFILLASVASVVCTALSVTVLVQGNFSDAEGTPTVTWFVLIGLVHSVPVVPLTLSVYPIIASLSGASFNWAIVRGLSPFIGMGMEVPGFVLEYMFEGADNWMTDNGYILYHFLMTALVMIVFAYIASSIMRKNSLIMTEKGLGELRC